MRLGILLGGCSPQNICSSHFQGEVQVGYKRGESAESPMSWPPECKRSTSQARCMYHELVVTVMSFCDMTLCRVCAMAASFPIRPIPLIGIS